MRADCVRSTLWNSNCPWWLVSIYDSFLPAVRRLEELGVEEREPSGNKGRIVYRCKTVLCGFQENKVLLKPIRGEPLGSWYWLFLAGYGQHIGTFTRQWLNAEKGCLRCTVKTFCHCVKVKWLETIWLFSLKLSRLVGGGSSWLYLPSNGFGPMQKSYTVTCWLLGEILAVAGGKPMFSNSTKRSLGFRFINEMFHCINTTRKLWEFWKVYKS